MQRFVWMLVALAVVLAACGGSDGEAGGGDEEVGASLSIEEPSDGAEVELPFTVRFSSDEDLGPIETGALHVHLWFDGSEDDYEVIESDAFEISDLSHGEHTITASLRNADHSSAGAKDEIAVTVVGGSGDGGEEPRTGNDY